MNCRWENLRQGGCHVFSAMCSKKIGSWLVKNCGKWWTILVKRSGHELSQLTKPGCPFTFQKQRSSRCSGVELERSPLWRQRPYLPPARLWSQSFGTVMGFILIDYLPEGATINSTYYTNLLQEDLRTALKNKRIGKLSSSPLLQRDNARPHTATMMKNAIQRLGWTLLPHPPYSPDLAPSDYHLFHTLKQPYVATTLQLLMKWKMLSASGQPKRLVPSLTLA